MNDERTDSVDERIVTEDETVVDEEEHAEAAAGLAAKLKKTREELRRVQTEKQALLEELQRTKADFLNARKRLEEDRVRDRERQLIDHVERLLPIFDSFTLAMDNKALWEKADPVWRKGVEGIFSQLRSVLAGYRIEQFFPLHERFDPNRHEALGTIAAQTEADHERIMAVVQPGYELKKADGSEIIRPARVTIGIFESLASNK